MKKLAFLFMLPIFCFCGCQEVEKTEATTEISLFTTHNFSPQILKGKVKSWAIKSYLVTEENGEFIKGEWMNDSLRKALPWSWDHTAEYDINGNVTRVEYYEEAGVTGYWETEYEDGFMAKSSWISKDTVRSYFLIKPDENGFFASAEYFQGVVDTLINSWEYVNNEMGRWIEVTSYSPDGSQRRKFTWNYNEEGLLVDRQVYADGDSLIATVLFEYDDQGNDIGRKSLKGDMSLNWHEIHKDIKFDDMGNAIQKVYWIDEELTGLDEITITYHEE